MNIHAESMTDSGKFADFDAHINPIESIVYRRVTLSVIFDGK